MASISTSYSKETVRYAVLALFLAQGLCFASWAGRLTDIKALFSISDFFIFGQLLTLQPIGKFLAIPIAGYLLRTLGSKTTILISLGGFIVSLLLIGLTANIYFLGTCFMLFGVFWNMTDISLNTQAVEVERMYGRTIIATFHAGWSIAACVGALLGFLMINLDISPRIHFLVVTLVCLGVVAYAGRFLLTNVSALENPNSKTDYAEKSNWKADWKNVLSEPLLLSLGLIWLFALVVENTMFDWSNVYFEHTIQAPKSMQIGFLIFMVMMTAGRLGANFAYRVWSKSTILVIAGILIFVGFLTSSTLIAFASSMAMKVIVNSLGFMMIGVGVSCMVPTIYSIVGDKVRNVSVGTALTVMATISFVGPLITNMLVGYVAREWSLQSSYLLVGFFGICIVAIVLLSKRLRR